MSEPDRPAWHWDEQAALRAELATQTEAAAAEVARWKARAERAEQRVEELLRCLGSTWPGR